MRSLRFLVVAILVSPLSLTLAAPAQKATPPANATTPTPEFAHRIPVRLINRDVRRGDAIRIRTVHGDRPRIEVGGTYLVEGSYTLASAEKAVLALSLTKFTRGTRMWTPDQRMDVGPESGSFRLIATMTEPGRLHVSFYVRDRDNPRRNHVAGGVYFENR